MGGLSEAGMLGLGRRGSCRFVFLCFCFLVFARLERLERLGLDWIERFEIYRFMIMFCWVLGTWVGSLGWLDGQWGMGDGIWVKYGGGVGFYGVGVGLRRVMVL